MENQFAEMPQPADIATRDKEDAMGAYLMMFAALAAGLPLPIINLIAAVVYYFVNNKKGRFVRFHLLQSFYSQFPTTLLNIGLVSWSLRIFAFEIGATTNLYWGYLSMVVLANLIYMVFSIIAAVKARKGEFFYFLFFGRLAYAQAFKIKSESVEDIVVNKAPQM